MLSLMALVFMALSAPMALADDHDHDDHDHAHENGDHDHGDDHAHDDQDHAADDHAHDEAVEEHDDAAGLPETGGPSPLMLAGAVLVLGAGVLGLRFGLRRA